MQGTLEAIHIAAKVGAPMAALDAAQIIADFGLEGDRKAQRGSHRQVLIINSETLDAFELQPGEIRENLTIRGLDIFALETGQEVQVGDVVLQVTKYCAPCEFMDSVRPGLRTAMKKQRGMLFRVISGGHVKVGDRVSITA